jgi:hypothetical protein
MAEKHRNTTVEELAEKVEHLEILVEELLEEIEIEEWGKRNECPPHAKRYIIRIDKVKYTVNTPRKTGRELLTLAGKTPPERFSLSQKLHGGHVEAIGLDEVADFTCPGVERFMTLPLDQTEG